jgi:hypothetical protein
MSTPPPVSTEKKGMSCLAMGGIGCLVLIVVLFLGGGIFVAKFLPPEWKSAIEEFSKDAAANPEKASAKLGIKIIPNVQIVREDDAAKTITFKVGADGEEMTMHYEGISSGKAKPRVTNSKGEEVNLGEPGAAAAPAPEAVTPAPVAPEAPAAPAVPAPTQN